MLVNLVDLVYDCGRVTLFYHNDISNRCWTCSVACHLLAQTM